MKFQGYVRYFETPQRCTVWARDKLIGFARSNRICKHFYEKYGGVKYDTKRNKTK